MELFSQQRRDAELRRLARVKQTQREEIAPISDTVVGFFKSVEKRHKKLGKISNMWTRLVPQMLQEHCCLEGLSKGTLTVLVDSSPHLYDLKQLLLAGLEKQILLACPGAGLRRIALKPGRWYDGANPQDRKLRFD